MPTWQAFRRLSTFGSRLRPRGYNVAMSASLPTALRPLSVFQIADATVGLYRRHFALFLAITLIPTLPLQLAQAAVATVQAGVLNIEPFDFTPRQLSPEEMEMNCLLGAVAIGLMALLWGVAVPLAMGALSVAVSSLFMGRRLTVGQAYGPVWRRLGSYLGLSFALFVMYSISMVLMCVFFAGIPVFLWIWAWFGMTPCVLLLERKGVAETFARSRRLADGQGLRLAGIGACFFLMFALIWFVLPLSLVGLVVSLWPFEDQPTFQVAVTQAIGMAVQIAITPLMCVLPAVMYMDTRVRKEGLDLAMALHRVSGAAPAA